MNDNTKMETTVNVSLNRKSNYLSFTSPILKNKKGHSRQIVKSVNNIKSLDGQIDWTKICLYIEEIKKLLSRFDEYSADYSCYLKAKRDFNQFVVDCVFDGTEFSNKYNQESTKRILNRVIPIHCDGGSYILPSVLFTGVSAGGKTTTLKQIIGSTQTSFPATMQANTTIGNFHIILENETKGLIGMSRFTTREVLEERIKFAIIDILKKSLAEENFNTKDIYSILIECLTIFGDRKCKLDYIISKQDLEDANFENLVKEVSKECWESFKKDCKKNEADLLIFDEFSQNISSQFFNEFGEYILNKESDSNHKLYELLNLVINLIKINVLKITKTMIQQLFAIQIEGKEVIKSITITGENQEYKFIQLEKNIIQNIDYPKVISIELNYKDGSKPDKLLRKRFFEIMEFISSASEKNIGKTLFPLVEEMRVKGNFRPLWTNDNYQINDCVLVDSEGLGHDMSKEGISIELRNIMSECRKIVFIQNGSDAIGNQFTDALELLISTGAIYKTSFCFNRMEKFDIDSTNSAHSRIKFIKGGIRNAVKKIAEEEERQVDKIVIGKEHIFEERIINNTLYFEYLSEVIEAKGGIVPERNRIAYEALNKHLEESNSETDAEVFEKVINSLLIRFNEQFDTVKHINKLISTFTIDSRLSLDTIKDLEFEPTYNLYKFTKLFIDINKEYSDNFLHKINTQPWQTVKTFNAHMCWNYDYREWGNLKPESEFMGHTQRKLLGFLVNPSNIELENQIKDKALFIEVMSNIVCSNLYKGLKNISEDAIFRDLLDSCWKIAMEQSGTGSTYRRKRIINDSIQDKFNSFETTNILFKKTKQLVFNNKTMQNMKIGYED